MIPNIIGEVTAPAIDNTTISIEFSFKLKNVELK
jgi:hypothetical protein